MTRMPAIARLLLDRLLGPDDPLAGDLAEEVQGGRSRWWLWRQVLLLIPSVVARDVRRHALRVVAGLVVGALAILIARGIADVLTSPVARTVLRFLPPSAFGPWHVFVMTKLMLWLATATLGGWVTAAASRRQRFTVTAVFVVLLIVIMVRDPGLHRLFVAARASSRYEADFVIYLAGWCMWGAGLVIGGLLLRLPGTRPALVLSDRE